MATLTGRTVGASYLELLKLNTATLNTGVTGSLLDVTDGGNTASALSISTTQIASSVDGSAAAPALTRKSDTNTGMFFPAADTIAVATTGTERLRIDLSGNVGIGTNSPSAKLEVVGSIITNAARTGNSSSGDIIVPAGLGLRFAHPTTAINATYSLARLNNPNIEIGDASWEMVLNAATTITTTAKVGVGTASPEGKLDAYGTGYFGFQNFSTQAVQKVLVLRGEPVSALYAQSRFNFYTTPGTTATGIAKLDIKSQYSTDSESSSLLTLTGSGIVGIGTAISGINAGSKLHISGGGSGARGALRLCDDGGTNYWDIGRDNSTSGAFTFADVTAERLRIDLSGNVGIGKAAGAGIQLDLSTDSARKLSTTTWTTGSDERLKTSIVDADKNRCYEIVKQVPLKYYTWKNEIYSQEQIKDRSKLGWIAQDVEEVFPKAVGTSRFAYNQVFEDVVTPELDSDGNAVFEDVVVPELDSEGNAVFEDVVVPELDSEGNAVFEDGVAKTRIEKSNVAKTRIEKSNVAKTRIEKKLVSEEVIEGCKDLNVDQIYAAMYGTIQKLIEKVETLEAKVVALQVA